jgi:putative ABC transport system permease protein
VATSPEVRSPAVVAAGNQNWSTQVMGESPSYFDIRQWRIVQGAAFTDMDVRGANKVAVIGKTIADQLYPGEEPLGQILRIRGVPFKIVGLLMAKGLSVQGSDQDDLVVIPYTSAMKRVQRVTTVRSIIVQAAKPTLLAPAQQQITELLRQRHRITPGRDDDFTVRNQQEIAEMATAQSKTMTMLLGAIAGVSLLVGGIGIMNIMLVSVTERTREIGIRMAIGARGKDILVQFLVEAVTLSAIGGLGGIAIGLGGSHLLAQVTSWPTLTPASWVAIALISSAVVGMASGFYPAWKASKLDPIDALRYE